MRVGLRMVWASVMMFKDDGKFLRLHTHAHTHTHPACEVWSQWSSESPGGRCSWWQITQNSITAHYVKASWIEMWRADRSREDRGRKGQKMGASASQIYFSIISHNLVAMMSCLGLKRLTLDRRYKKKSPQITWCMIITEQSTWCVELNTKRMKGMEKSWIFWSRAV